MLTSGTPAELHNGFPVIIVKTYAAPDGQAYVVKPDTAALSGADLKTLKSTKPFRLTAHESSRVQSRVSQ